MATESEHGVAAWSAPEWRAGAVAWIDERLAAAGAERSGPVEQVHVRPWSTVLTAPTTSGPVWMKAAAPETAHEVALCELLARVAPERVLVPLATDPARGWLLLPDGGPVLGERGDGPALDAALARYGGLQRELAPHADALVALGVPDMRPAVLPRRLDEALEVVAELGERHPAGRAVQRDVSALAGSVAAWCEQLAAAPAPASLDHNDLHPWNILDGGAGPARYYDWGDSVVAHPFAVLLVPLRVLRGRLRARPGDPRLDRARDAYLEAYADVAPHARLVETVELACRLAMIARTLTWARALRTSWEQGEEVDDRFATAPIDWLGMLRDRSHLGDG